MAFEEIYNFTKNIPSSILLAGLGLGVIALGATTKRNTQSILFAFGMGLAAYGGVVAFTRTDPIGDLIRKLMGKPPTFSQYAGAYDPYGFYYAR